MLAPRTRFLAALLIAALVAAARSQTKLVPDEFLIVAETASIRFINATSGEETLPPIQNAQTRRVVGVDFDGTTQTVFWTDTTLDSVLSARLNGTSVRTIAQRLVIPSGVAYDPYSKLVYFTDSSLDLIALATLDGSYTIPLIHTELYEPRSLILQPLEGYMYWIDLGIPAKIERAYMSGANRIALIADDLGWPNGLTIYNDRLYWADGKTERLESSNLNGQDRQVMLSFESNIHPFGMIIRESKLFWTDRYSRQVYQVPIGSNLTQANVSAVATTANTPYGIAYYSAADTPTEGNSCSKNNGGCDQVCMPEPSGGRKCACSVGVLGEDGHTCRDSDMCIGLVVFNEIYWFVVHEDSATLHQAKKPFKNATKPLALAVDPLTQLIYYTDITEKAIIEVSPSGKKRTVLQEKPVDYPDNVAVDYVSKVLYYTDRASNVIGIVAIDGSWRMTLVENLDEPRGLALDIENGMVYWSDWGTKPLIERISMTGERRKVLVSESLVWPNGITLDVQNDLLYWADARLDRIEVCNLDGTNRRRLGTYSQVHPYSLILYDSLLLWSDWQMSKIGTVSTNGSNFKMFSVPYYFFSQPTGLALCGSLLQKSVKSACSSNPCQEHQICLPSSAKDYKCICKYGSLNSKTKKCERPPKFLLVAEEGEIRGVDLNSTAYDPKEAMVPIFNVDAYAIDYDLKTETIYWTQPEKAQIWSAPLDGSSQPTQLNGKITKPTALAVDWISRLLFYADVNQNEGTIGVISLDGTMQTTLISGNLSNPTSIAVDPVLGFLAWTDTGLFPKIEKAYMNGANRDFALPPGLVRNPTSVAINRRDKMLFFSDADQDIIMGVPLFTESDQSFASKSFVVTTVDIHPFSITTFNDDVYFADHNLRGVWIWPTTGHSASRIFRTDQQPTGLRIYDVQQVANTTCAVNNGGCRQMCLAIPGGRRCGCTSTNTRLCWPKIVESPRSVILKEGEGFTLRCRYGNPDETGIDVTRVVWHKGRKIVREIEVGPYDNTVMLNVSGAKEKDSSIYTCTVHNNYGYATSSGAMVSVRGPQTLLYGVGDQIHGVSLHTGADVLGTPIPAIGVHALAFDATKELVYWSSKSRGIYRAYLNGTSPDGGRPWFDGVKSPGGIAIDWMSRLLYYVDQKMKKISAVSLDDPSRHIDLISTDLTSPTDVDVDPVTGYMAWTDQGVSNSNSKVEIAYADGKNRETVTKKVKTPVSVAIDSQSKQLFYLGYDDDTIYSYNLKTKVNDLNPRSEKIYPSSMDIYNSQVFYADDRYKGLWRWTGKSGSKIVSTTQNPSGVVIYDSTRFPEAVRCGKDNGGCAQICRSIPGGRTCACTEGNVEDCLPKFLVHPRNVTVDILGYPSVNINIECAFPWVNETGISYLHGSVKKNGKIIKIFNADQLSKMASMSIKIFDVAKSDAGNYWCSLTNKYGEVNSLRAFLQVLGPNPTQKSPSPVAKTTSFDNLSEGIRSSISPSASRPAINNNFSSGSKTNVAAIVAPIICLLLLITIGIVILILYLNRRQKQKAAAVAMGNSSSIEFQNGAFSYKEMEDEANASNYGSRNDNAYDIPEDFGGDGDESLVS